MVEPYSLESLQRHKAIMPTYKNRLIEITLCLFHIESTEKEKMKLPLASSFIQTTLIIQFCCPILYF